MRCKYISYKKTFNITRKHTDCKRVCQSSVCADSKVPVRVLQESYKVSEGELRLTGGEDGHQDGRVARQQYQAHPQTREKHNLARHRLRLLRGGWCKKKKCQPLKFSSVQLSVGKTASHRPDLLIVTPSLFVWLVVICCFYL